jgi:sugar phosphate isomerase/epimerase
MTAPDLIASCWTTAGDAAPLRGDEVSPLDLRARIEAAARTGWRGFGILHADLDANRDALDWPTLKSVLDDNGIVHVELEFLNDWWTDGDRRRRSDEVRADLLRAAEVLGARHIKIGSEFGDAPVDPDRFAQAFDQLSTQARDAGTRIALEPTPWSNLPTVRSGADFVRTVANPHGGLTVDIWHVYRGGTPLEELGSFLTADLVFAVELNDARSEVQGTLFEDTINNRRLCGQGDWDVPGFIRAIRQLGFDGPWGVEIISDQHRARPLPEAVQVAYDTAVSAFNHAENPQA